MTKTREEFIRRWRAHLAGMALFGIASEVRDGPLARAAKILDVPADVEMLLGVMYDDLLPAPKVPSTNGPPVQQPVKRTT